MLVSKRHKRPALKTRVVKRITEIPPDDWNKIFPNILESYDFFRTLDESSLEQFSLFYIMVYDRKTPVGATACFLVNYPLDTTLKGPLKRITGSIRKFMPNIFSLRAVVCGMPLGQGRIGMPAQSEAIIHAILRRVEQIAKKARASVVAFKDFDQSYTGILDPLQKKGFSKFDSLPTTELNIWFKNFEEYLMTLSGATRYDLRRKFKKTDGHVKIDLKIVDALDDDTLQDVHKLYLGMVARQSMVFELLPIDFFKNISKNMPGHTKFFLYRIKERLVAFLLCLTSEDMLIDYYVGLDYSVAHKYHLYFVKFRDALNWCINHNIKKYEMGTTSYEPKKRLGFDLVPLYLYVRLRNKALRPIFNLICQFLKFENFDPDLKKTKTSRIS